MARAKFPCPWCGAAKKSVTALCTKCMRFGTAKGYCTDCSAKLPNHDRGCMTARAVAALKTNS